VLVAAAGLVFGTAFLANFLPLGTAGDLFSAGTMQPLSVAVGLEVTGGFVLILSEFLDQTLVVRRRGASR
jgi:multicomponent Na+:H+ antiporter subunit B